MPVEDSLDVLKQLTILLPSDRNVEVCSKSGYVPSDLMALLGIFTLRLFVELQYLDGGHSHFL